MDTVTLAAQLLKDHCLQQVGDFCNISSIKLSVTDDPGEHFNIADQHEDIVKALKARLVYYRQTMVPANFPPKDKNGDPKYFGGVWSPGWC